MRGPGQPELMRKGRDLGRAGPWLLSLWLPRAGRLRLKRTRGTTPRCCWWGTSVTWRTSEWCPRNAVGSLPTTWVSTHRTAALIGLDRDPDPDPHTPWRSGMSVTQEVHTCEVQPLPRRLWQWF